MESGIEETLLINALLPGFSFRNDRLRKVDFSQADLRKCDFRQAVFELCSLRDANMAGSRFDGADLRGADIGGLRLIDASLFRGATISRAQAGVLLSELGQIGRASCRESECPYVSFTVFAVSLKKKKHNIYFKKNAIEEQKVI